MSLLRLSLSFFVEKDTYLRLGGLALDTPKKSGRISANREQFCRVSFPNTFQKAVFALDVLSLCLCCQACLDNGKVVLVFSVSLWYFERKGTV